MKKALSEVIGQGTINGLYYGNRILLPFSCHILRVIVNDDIITDFSPTSDTIYYDETDDYTEIYFLNYTDIKDAVSKYETIKVVASNRDESIFDIEKHYKLVIRLEEKHKITIKKSDEDILFIE